MAQKKKKNANYVTEKTIQAKLEREKAEKKKKTVKLALIIAAIAVVAALAVLAVIGIVNAVKNNQSFEVTHHASIEVANYGTIHVELYGDEAPITVENFVKLANSGYYNGTTFHRIIEGFMAQGGNGAATSSITGEFESNGIENNILLSRGAIAMARTNDPNSASSQFFIVHDTEGAEHLNGEYAGFGRVTSGMDVIDQICKDAKPYDNNGSILPTNQPVITSISIHTSH